MSRIFQKINAFSKQQPDKIAVIEGDHLLTYKQLIDKVKILAKKLEGELKNSSVKVGFCLQEGVQVPILVLALNFLRVTVIPLNPKLKAEQLNYLLSFCDTDVVIVDRTTVNLFYDADNQISVINLDSIDTSSGILDEVELGVIEEAKPYDQFLITLSSGSTGNPKPIIFSEKNKLDRSAQAVQLYEVTEKDICLCASPFFHSLGQRLILLPLLHGATLVYLPSFTAQKWVDLVVKHQVTFTIPVSTHLHLLVEHLLNFPEKFSSLRCLVSSSAAIDKHVKHKLFATLDCDFHEMYGASEVATATSLNKEQAISEPDSVGYPCPGVTVKVVDENFSSCKPMDKGRIVVKSHLASAGYYHLPEINEKSFVDGYFITGDIGCLDENGFLYFIDREKDIIISGGSNIYPSDIEEHINVHPKVDLSIIVGIDDVYLGEAVVAVIVLKEGDRKNVEKEVRITLRKKLSVNQQPLAYIFKNEFPISGSGKVDRKQVQEEINLLGLDLTAKLRTLQCLK